jgi:hypothetical protein
VSRRRIEIAIAVVSFVGVSLIVLAASGDKCPGSDDPLLSSSTSPAGERAGSVKMPSRRHSLRKVAAPLGATEWERGAIKAPKEFIRLRNEIKKKIFGSSFGIGVMGCRRYFSQVDTVTSWRSELVVSGGIAKLGRWSFVEVVDGEAASPEAIACLQSLFPDNVEIHGIDTKIKYDGEYRDSFVMTGVN